MDLTSQKLEKQNVSFFDAPFMKQRVNSFFGGQDFAMKGAGFAAADDDDDAVLGQESGWHVPRFSFWPQDSSYGL